jgi:hypothetical protein
VTHSQSHLTSLATLLESAEARASALPQPLVPEKDDSGLIDIVAMQRRAQEERAAAATRTPVPTVAPVRASETDPDFYAAAGTQRRKRHLLIGAVAGSMSIIGIAIGVAFSGGAPAHAAVADPQVAAAAPAPPPPAATAPAPPAAEPTPAAAPEPVAAAAPDPPPKPKAHKRKSTKSSGPKLTKVTSGGTAR